MSEFFDKATIGGIDIPCTDANAQGRLTVLEAKFDSNGKVVSSALPSYVDDVIEGYLKAADGKFYTTLEDDTYSGEITGETSKIYVNLSNNKSYRWGGSAYIEISSSDVTGITIGSGGTNYTPSQGVITIPAYEAGAQVHIAPTTAEVKSALNTVTTSQGKYLKDDGTWDTPQDTTYVFNTAYDATTNKAATMADIPSSLPANGGDAATVNSHSVNSDVPANAVFTDTTYEFINNDYNASTNKVATQNDLANGNTAYTEAVTFGTGINGSATSVVSVPVDKSLCIVTIADGQTAQSFSLVSAPNSGRTIHVMVDNSGNTSDLTVTVPHGTTDGINYVNTNDLASGSMDVAAGKIGEINIVYASSKAWVRYIGS